MGNDTWDRFEGQGGGDAGGVSNRNRKVRGLGAIEMSSLGVVVRPRTRSGSGVWGGSFPLGVASGSGRRLGGR